MQFLDVLTQAARSTASRSPISLALAQSVRVDTWALIARLARMAHGRAPERAVPLTGELRTCFTLLPTTDNIEYYRQLDAQIRTFVSRRQAAGDHAYGVPGYLLRYGDPNIRRFHQEADRFDVEQRTAVLRIQHTLQERLEWLKSDPELLEFCLRYTAVFDAYAFQTHACYASALANLSMHDRLGIVLTPKLSDTVFNLKAWPTIFEVAVKSVGVDTIRRMTQVDGESGFPRARALVT